MVAGKSITQALNFGDKLYVPSEWGQTYHALTTDEALGAGAAGPGKSMVLLMDPMHQIMVEHERCMDPLHPYHIPLGMSRGASLHLRRTSPMLAETLGRARRIFPRIDPGIRYNDKHQTFTWTSGYRSIFGHCKDPNDWEIHMSQEYSHIGFDELIQFLEMQYEQISGRLRSSDPVLATMLKVRAMSNPMLSHDTNMVGIHTKNPQWVRDRFVEPAPEGKVVLQQKIEMSDGTTDHVTRIYLPATLADNPDPTFRRSYERTLRGKSEHTRQALLFGNWYAVAGSFFGDDWNKNIHVCRPFQIPEDWPRFRSMDWGYKSPGCVLWWAMDPDENLYCENELTFQGKDAREVAHMIRDWEDHMDLWDGERSQISGPADTQLWEERGDVGRTKAQIMAEEGVLWTKADKKSRMTNGQRLLQRLRDHDDGNTVPGLVFMDVCKRSIMTIPATQTDMNNPECPADGGEDHWLDATLYACAYASHGSRGIPSRRITDEWDADRRYEKKVRRGDRGRCGYGGL